jgi:signal transduction histidine kinase
MLNLVDNAIKFTPAGGRVTISLRATASEAVITVADTGIGIAPEEQQAIFDRFYRVEHARSKRGSGLGLSISSWIAAAHAGRIDVESRPGRGSTFTVHLPGPVTCETRPPREVIGHPAE